MIRGRPLCHYIVALVFGIALAAGCTNRRDDGAPPALPGTHWLAENIGANPVVVGAQSTLVFSEETEGQVNGNAGCNLYFGTVTIESDSMRFGPLGATLRMCGNDALMRQERDFLDALENTRKFSFSADGKMLMLTGADDADLVRLSRMFPDEDAD